MHAFSPCIVYTANAFLQNVTPCLSEVPNITHTYTQTVDLKGLCPQASEDAVVKQITLKQDVLQVRSKDYVRSKFMRLDIHVCTHV